MKLIYFECLKQLKKRGIKIFLILSIGLIILNAVICKTSSDNTENWKAVESERLKKCQVDLQEAKEKLNSEKKEGKDTTFTQFSLEWKQEEVALLEYSLQNNIPLDGMKQWKFVNDNFYTSYILFVFLMVLAIQSIQNEYTFGTVKQIFIQSKGVQKVLFAKEISLMLFTIIGYMLHLLVSLIFGSILFIGDGGTNVLLQYENGKVINYHAATLVLPKYGACMIYILVIMCILQLLCSIFTKGVIPLLVGLALWVGGGFLSDKTSNLPLSQYYIFNNMNLNQYIKGEEILYPGNTLLVSSISIVIHIVIFLIITHFIWRKKEIY